MSTGQKDATMTPPPASNQNIILMLLVTVALSGIISWKASEYVNDNNRVRDEVTKLRAENEALKKEIEKIQSVPQGWRPGNPIGNPAGSSPTGATAPK